MGTTYTAICRDCDARFEGLERKASEVIAERRDIIRGHTDIN